jgi:hypothetical protein
MLLTAGCGIGTAAAHGHGLSARAGVPLFCHLY